MRYTSTANGIVRKLASTSPVVVQAPHPAISADPPAPRAEYHGKAVTATSSAPRTTIVHLVILASMTGPLASPVHGAPCYRDTIDNIFLAGATP